MDISVIIPTYKPQSYLWECFNSLTQQTFESKHYEIIVILNGCNQPYASEIQAYINSHPNNNWVYFQTDLGGVSNARNIALDYAHGEYITFIDDDDFVSPTYLEELFAAASPDRVSLCYPLCFEDGTKDYKEYHITCAYHALVNHKNVSVYDARRFFSGPVYKLIHRNVINNHRYDCRLKNGEDTLFMFAISDSIKHIAFTSKTAIYYRRDRIQSAVNRKRPRIDKIYSNIIQIKEYVKLFFGKPFKYNLLFLLTRVGGALLGMVR